MRKVIACIITLILIFVLVSCGKQEEPTTIAPPTYNAEPTTSATTTTTPSYVLTTAQDNTVYWQETTRFEFDIPTTQGTATTANSNASDYDIDFTVAPISKPDVNTSVVATTQIASDNTSFVPPTTSNNVATTSQVTTTTEKNVNSVALELNSDSTDGNNNLVLEIDASNFSGGLASCSVNVIVSIDGTESETTPTLTVPSKTNGLGYYDCVIDLSGLEVTSGTVVTYTIPAGTIKSSDGTAVNQGFSGTYTI